MNSTSRKIRSPAEEPSVILYSMTRGIYERNRIGRPERMSVQIERTSARDNVILTDCMA